MLPDRIRTANDYQGRIGALLLAHYPPLQVRNTDIRSAGCHHPAFRPSRRWWGWLASNLKPESSNPGRGLKLAPTDVVGQTAVAAVATPRHLFCADNDYHFNPGANFAPQRLRFIPQMRHVADAALQWVHGPYIHSGRVSNAYSICNP